MYTYFMLVGLRDGSRIAAWDAEKGPDYFCPNCDEPVILKKGRLIIHHFAHERGANCAWASGETREHMSAKRFLAKAFQERGLIAEIEKVVLSAEGDRRADVLLTNCSGSSVAIEVQHTPISYDQIESRTLAYIDASIPVIWVGVFTTEMRQAMVRTPGGYVIRKFSPRPWHKWVHAYNYKEIWFVDSENGELWKGKLTPHMLEVAQNYWYGEGGEEHSAGGYSKPSKRWRDLHVEGPYLAKNIGLSTPLRRQPWSGGGMKLPAGRMLRFST